MPYIRQRRKPLSDRRRKLVLSLLAALSVGWLALAVAALHAQENVGIAYALLALVWMGLTVAVWLRRPRSFFVSQNELTTRS
jgi:hypothetical protein